jgi:hypothetical protein
MFEPFFGLKFWSDLLSQGLAGMLGAVVGATVAFRYERRKSREELDDRRLREANELSERRAAAGNLAIFTLAKIYSDLWNYRSQIIDPARNAPAPWHSLGAYNLTMTDGHKFDIPSIAFLFRSIDQTMPLRLTIEEARFADVVTLISQRSKIHLEEVQPAIEAAGFIDSLSPAEAEKACGPRVTRTMKGLTGQIIDLVDRGLVTAPELADQLGRVLVRELPDQRIIRFSTATETVATE